MIKDSRIPIPGQRIAARLIDDRAYLLDPRKEELQCLNEVGSFVWGQIALRTLSVSELNELIVEHFEIAPDQAYGDLKDFFAELESREFIRYRD